MSRNTASTIVVDGVTELCEDFQHFHQCLDANSDPFVGLVRKETTPSCCPMKEFVDAANSVFDSEQNGELFRQNATKYGKLLQQADALRAEQSIRIVLYNYWKLHGGECLNQESLYDLVQNIFPNFLDQDNVTWRFGPCSVCFADCRFVHSPPCCGYSICQPCWSSFIENYIESSNGLNLYGVYDLRCFNCSKLVPYNETIVCSEPDLVAQLRHKLKLQKAKMINRCPCCLEIPSMPLELLNDDTKSIMRIKSKRKGGFPLDCQRCGHTFCCLCGCNEHTKVTCNKLANSDVGLRKWLSSINKTRPNFPVR